MIDETVEDLITIHGARFKFIQNSNIKVFLGKSSIRRIVENLATNAIKYGSQTDLIEISLQQTDNEFLLSVHNEGKPIAQEDIGFLFDDFTRTVTAKNSDKIGWGLGLPLVKGLTEAHNGKIFVKSDVNTGTTFFVKMPLLMINYNDSKFLN